MIFIFATALVFFLGYMIYQAHQLYRGMKENERKFREVQQILEKTFTDFSNR